MAGKNKSSDGKIIFDTEGFLDNFEVVYKKPDTAASVGSTVTSEGGIKAREPQQPRNSSPQITYFSASGMNEADLRAK